MKKGLTIMMAAFFLALMLGGSGQAAMIYGSVWEDATAQSMDPRLGPPALPPTSTFYVNVADQINFDSRLYVGNATYDQFLNSPVWTGTDIGSQTIDTFSGHGTFFQFTGSMYLENGQTFTVVHDDGFVITIGNVLYDAYWGPVIPTPNTITWNGATGIYPFVLNYGAYNGYPEVLSTRGATFVPEPMTMLLLGFGLLGLAGARRFK
jgi:hypothetical protein